jgi:hypothetical protein
MFGQMRQKVAMKPQLDRQSGEAGAMLCKSLAFLLAHGAMYAYVAPNPVI